MNPPDSRLQARGLSTGYDDRVIVSELDVDIPTGSFTVIIGPNGCGKSTLLRSLARLIKPFAGSVLLDGADIAGIRTATSTAPTSRATSAGT